MKTSLQSIVLLVLSFFLFQCEEDVKPSNSEFSDAATQAQGRKEFVLYAIPSSGTEYNFLVYLYGDIGTTITVDWGDGTSEVLVFEQVLSFDYGSVELRKFYENAGRYEITITGELDEITGINSGYGEGVFDSANFSALRNLGQVRIGLTSGPAVFDLSKNRKLYEVWLTNVNELEQVILPKRHTISTVAISGPNQMTTAEVDYVIESVYTNAVKGKIYNGAFSVADVFHLNEGDEGYGELVGPPSPSSVTMLRTLQNEYGWDVTPYLN